MIEFEDMEKGKIAIEPTIVVDIYRTKRVSVYTSILKDLPMVLACNIVYDLLLGNAGV